jgi:nucleoside 2-deoxyribosyltransferase
MRRDFRGRTDARERELVEGDLTDIDSCDAVLAAFTHPDEGTAMEARYAHRRGIPVVAYTAARPRTHGRCMSRVCADLEQAIRALGELEVSVRDPRTSGGRRRGSWSLRGG